MPRPTTLPRWASVNPVPDPTSGQDNVIEPSSGKKDTGWNFKDRPSRNEDNWYKFTNFEWITWFDTQIGAKGFDRQTDAGTLIYTGITGSTVKDLEFVIGSGIVHCFLPSQVGANSGGGVFQIGYGGSLLPAAIANSQHMAVSVESNAVTQIEKVTISGGAIPTLLWLQFEFNGSSTGFTQTGAETVGLPRGMVISYMVA